jgi:hypothetical protein
MRKRLLILAAGVVLLALGIVAAVFFVANRPPTPGGLESAPTDVEIVTSTVPKPKPIKRPPPPSIVSESPANVYEVPVVGVRNRNPAVK